MAPKVVKNLMGYNETKLLLIGKNYFENLLFCSIVKRFSYWDKWFEM